jgi:endonuclease/exonuclease/phosphatase family metal-dependent hydrolase
MLDTKLALADTPVQAAILSQRLAAYLDRHKQSVHGQPLPVLLAGDFNSLWRKIASDPFDEVSAPVVRGRIENGGV